MLKRQPESLQGLEFQKATRYHADIESNGMRPRTVHFDGYSDIEARRYFESFGKILRIWKS